MNFAVNTYTSRYIDDTSIKPIQEGVQEFLGDILDDITLDETLAYIVNNKINPLESDAIEVVLHAAGEIMGSQDIHVQPLNKLRRQWQDSRDESKTINIFDFFDISTKVLRAKISKKSLDILNQLKLEYIGPEERKSEMKIAGEVIAISIYEPDLAWLEKSNYRFKVVLAQLQSLGFQMDELSNMTRDEFLKESKKKLESIEYRALPISYFQFGRPLLQNYVALRIAAKQEIYRDPTDEDLYMFGNVSSGLIFEAEKMLLTFGQNFKGEKLPKDWRLDVDFEYTNFPQIRPLLKKTNSKNLRNLKTNLSKVNIHRNLQKSSLQHVGVQLTREEFDALNLLIAVNS